MKSFRFNLATLLVAIGVLACALGYLVQAGFAEALFKIQSNQLSVDSEGVLRGYLACQCSIAVSQAGSLRNVSDDEARI